MIERLESHLDPGPPGPDRRGKGPGGGFDDRLAILNEVTLALNSTLEPGALLDRILDASIRYTGATTGSVVLLDSDGCLRIAAARGLGTDVTNEVVLQVGEGITGWVAQENQPLNVDDVRVDPRYIMVKEHIRSELAVPMVLGKKVIGVISVDSSKEANFSNDDLRVLTFVGTQAAQILENSKTFNELRRKSEQDATLLEVSHALGSALDLTVMFQRVGEILAKRCAMRRSFLVLRNPETEELSIELAHGMTEAEKAKGRYRIGEGVTGRVVEAGKPLGIKNVHEEPTFLGKTLGKEFLGNGHGPMSFLAVPIFQESETVGVLGALRPFPGDAQFEADLALLQIIASTISHAVRIHFKVLTERQSLLEENRILREDLKTRYGFDQFDNLVGQSEAMQRVYSVIQNVARSRSTVLIRGESGTGKELIAHAIHFNSPRADRPLVKVNCAAIPENLLEAELFGHIKGSFTGAVADRKGRLLQANEGTLFLDEIGDMSPVLQVKILRVLQEREVEPVGSDKSFEVNVRIIAATHQNLENMVREGSFREDLYYRLNVVPIVVPPLRDRIDDVPMLVDHFLESWCNENAIPLIRTSAEAIRVLMRYPWPGNVRELENVIERTVILCGGDAIEPHHLPSPLGAAPLQAPMGKGDLSPAPAGEDAVASLVGECFERPELQGRVWDEVMGRIEGELIDRALERSGGVRLKAADLLGIHRNTLRKKLEEYKGNHQDE